MRTVLNPLLAAVLLTALVIATFVVFEPVVSRAATDTFVITQTFADEISFSTIADDVSMVGSINGLTGGFATGTTYAVVKTNDADGYNMTIAFSTTTAMQGDTTDSEIANYTPATPGTADFAWVANGSGNAAEFGYTVSASTTADIDLSFKDNGTICGAGGADVLNKCWMNPSTTAETIMNRTSGAAATGATTTIKFKVSVPSNSNPALEADNYIATATLTATNN